MTNDLRLKAKIIRCYPVFEKMSQLMIIALAAELIEFKTFKKDDLIQKQSECAPTSIKQNEIVRMHAHLTLEKKRVKKVA